MRHLLFFSVVCLVVACGGRQQRQPDTTVEPAHMPRVFLPAIPPSRLTAEETTEWMRWHYWDKFDFADTLFIAEIDTAQMVQAYARYISLLSMKPTDGAPIDSLMQRASSSRQMHDYFAWLGEVILHGPNSPLRNDEFYIPVLQSIWPVLTMMNTNVSLRPTTWNWLRRTASADRRMISVIRWLPV